MKNLFQINDSAIERKLSTLQILYGYEPKRGMNEQINKTFGGLRPC